MKNFKFTFSLLAFLLSAVISFGQEVAQAKPGKQLETTCVVADEYILAIDAFHNAIKNVNGFGIMSILFDALEQPTTTETIYENNYIATVITQGTAGISLQQFQEGIGNHLYALEVIIDLYGNGHYTESEFFGIMEGLGLLDSYNNMINSAAEVANNCLINPSAFEALVEERVIALLGPKNPNIMNYTNAEFWDTCGGKYLKTFAGSALDIGLGCNGASVSVTGGAACVWGVASAVGRWASFLDECG